MWPATCLFLLSIAPAHALELAPRVQAHGFFSQSLASSSANNFGGHSDGGVATELREIGGNLSWRASADWLFSGQALSRWAGKTDRGDLRLDYGFVDHTLLSDIDDAVGVRLGKIRNPYGFYNATRDLADARPGILMPQSIYLDRVRNFFLAAPGIGFYGHHDSPKGHLSWQLSALNPEADGADLARFMTGSDGRFRGRDSWLGQVMLGRPDGAWRGGFSLGQMNLQYRPGAADALLAGRTNLPTWVFSLEHNEEDWSFTGEYGQTGVHGQAYGATPQALYLDRSQTAEAWYGQATRRLGQGWQGFLRYDVLYEDRLDRNGAAFAAANQQPAYLRYAKDWTLGARRDVGYWSWSGEWHRVDGTAWLSSLDTSVSASRPQWNLFLLQGARYY